ncbi:glutaminase A [Colwellia psychrerythraea]|uniref:Glutaminase n=1 Tax=Colwellia psychrerythraea TaxID=28229 RepID=A0A099KUM5_COLPS|nr:glutaminase A [Colwellia psychrerythraea]KGJ94469.1 Glutaminase [Colwellia psychrerythraea]
MKLTHSLIIFVQVLVLTCASPALAKSPQKPIIQSILDDTYQKFKHEESGKNADYIPALAKVDSTYFGLAVATPHGEIYTKGDVNQPFSIQSISKVFTLALAMEQKGPQIIVDKIGVNATGLAFNSVTAIELNKARSVNPLVNAGAIATVSLLDGKNEQSKWSVLSAWYDNFANRKLSVLEDVYESESETNGHNRAIAELLSSYNRFYGDVDINLAVYTRQCSVAVTTKDLAVMASVLANNGVHPLTDKRLMSSENVSRVLAVMTTAGLYENSGQWAYQVGLPAKSGVGGGIIAVSPGRFAVAVFSPRLDGAGNSVRAQQAINFIAEKLHANIF